VSKHSYAQTHTHTHTRLNTSNMHTHTHNVLFMRKYKFSLVGCVARELRTKLALIAQKNSYKI